MTRHLIWLALVGAACGGNKQPVSSDPVQASSTGADAVVVLTVDERVARAAAMLTTGNPSDATAAIAELQPLLIEAPDRADIPYNLGLAHHQLEDGLNARKYYLRSTAIDPSLGSAWLNLGALSEQGGQYRRALQHYRAGMQSAPDAPDLVVGAIGVLRRMGRHEEALREGKAALARDSNNIDVYNNLGLVYIDQGKPDLAQFIYQKALNTIDGADNNATLHANLGRAYLEKKRPYNAKIELEKALQLDPDLVAAMLYLADLAMDDRDWDTTASLLEKAALLDSSNAAIHMNLGIAYRGLGQHDRAKTEYETALRLEPENPDPYINIGLLLGQYKNDFDGGIAAIQQYRSRGGEHSARADELLTSFQERKSKFEADVARKVKRDADRAKREEEARLAAEYEAMQDQWRQEQEEKKAKEAEAQQRAEAAAAAAIGASVPAPAPPPTSDAQPAVAPTPAPAPTPVAPPTADPAPPAAPVPAAPPAQSGVWGAPSASQAPPPAPAVEPVSPAPPAPAPAPAPTPAPAPIPEPPPASSGVWGSAPLAAPAAPAPAAAPAPVRGTRQSGAPCASDNQCVEGLVCGGGVCTGNAPPAAAPEATRGTRQTGAPCSSDNQCTEGLSCTNNACAASGGNSAGDSWGGW